MGETTKALIAYQGQELLGRVVFRVADEGAGLLRLSKIEPREEGAAWPEVFRTALLDRRAAGKVSGLDPTVFEPGTFPKELVAFASRQVERGAPGFRLLWENATDWAGFGPKLPEGAQH